MGAETQLEGRMLGAETVGGGGANLWISVEKFCFSYA